MNTDVIQRILHVIVNIQNVKYKDFSRIKKYLVSTEYDASFGPYFEQIEDFYKTRHNTMPDSSWVMRQFPDISQSYIPVSFHEDDIYVLTSILKDESLKNKVIAAAGSNDFEKSLTLLTEYKNDSLGDIKEAPTTVEEVFKNFYNDRELLGDGIKTGLLQLDADIDFLQYRNFTALVAPTKSFKTTLACNIVYDAVMNQSKNVIYFTLEDEYRSIWANLLSRHSCSTPFPITVNEIKKYKLTKDRDNLFEKHKRNFDNSASGHLVVLSSEFMHDFTPDSIDAQIDYYAKLWGNIDMCVVDHLSILNDPIPGRKDLVGPALSKEYVRYFTKKSISYGKKGFVLLGLAQVNREYTEKLIKGEKMYAIGAASTSEIERSCSLMLCTYSSDEMKKSSTLQLSIVINRSGPSDITYTLNTKPEFSVIGDVYVNQFDEQTIEEIVHGNLEIPLSKYKNFGVSFTSFAEHLKKSI